MGFVASFLGPIVTGIGQFASSQANASEAKYQEQIARNNAAYASAAGQVKAEQEGMRQSATLGRVKAGIAANNVDVNSGSAVEVREGQREIGEVSEATVENNAILQAYGYKEEAELHKAEASDDLVGGWFGLTGSLLEAASQTAPGFGDSGSAGLGKAAMLAGG